MEEMPQERKELTQEEVKAQKEKEIVKKIIKKAVNRIMQQGYVDAPDGRIEINISNSEDIKFGVKTHIVAPLTFQKGEKPPQVTEEIKKQIELVMGLFDEVYDEAYQEELKALKEFAKNFIKIA